MKVLHTSDWHLGASSFAHADRSAEYEASLQAIAEIAEREQCEVVVIAGDVFDQQLPSAESEDLYYRTLVNLLKHGVREIFVMGGNHDSLVRLSAVGPLAEIAGIHILARCTPEEPGRHVFELKEADGTPVAMLCALPFLSDAMRNRILSVNGLSVPPEERERVALRWMQEQVVRIAEERRGDRPLPIWLTGHLCLMTEGAAWKDPVGGLHGYPENWVPPAVDAVMLGHIHRPGQVGRGWNCGSLLCLDFQGAEIPRQVYVWDTASPKAPVAYPMPVTQAIRTVQGANEEELKAAIRALKREFPMKEGKTVFVHAENTSEVHIPHLKETLDALIGEERATVRLLRVTNPPMHRELSRVMQRAAEQMDLSPGRIFEVLLETDRLSDEEKQRLRTTFGELLASLADQKA